MTSPAPHLPPVILPYQQPGGGQDTLTFDLAESLVGESVGEREEKGDKLEDVATRQSSHVGTMNRGVEKKEKERRTMSMRMMMWRVKSTEQTGAGHAFHGDTSL